MFHATNGFDQGCSCDTSANQFRFCQILSRGLRSWPITEVNTEVLKWQLPGKWCLSRFLKRTYQLDRSWKTNLGWHVIWFSIFNNLTTSNFCRSTEMGSWGIWNTWKGNVQILPNYQEPPKSGLVPKYCHSSGILSSRSAVSLLTCFSSIRISNSSGQIIHP